MAGQFTIFDLQVLDHSIKPDPVAGGMITDNLVRLAAMDRHQALYTTMKQAVEMGLSIWPPRQDGSKAPFGNSWKERQQTAATLDDLRSLYKGDALTGIGAICGKVSGNLECLDYDERGIYECYKEAAIAIGLKDLLDRLEGGYKEHSPNGVHLLYRCGEIGGSTKLATRPKRPEEMKHGNDKTKTLIETKGDRGYVIIAPTFGAVNPSGSYDLISGSITKIPTITPEERQDLFALARTFQVNSDETIASDREHLDRESSKAGGRPGDEFNERATWLDILTPHGWKPVYERNGVIYLRRPGKSKGISATIGHKGTDLFHCFTSSSPFEPDQSYTKFGAYSFLNHNGDFSAAGKDLAEQGYGSKRSASDKQSEENDKGEDPESWPEPIPFNDYSTLPKFPIEALPGVCGSMVQALADSCQVDMGLPGSMMLAVLSAAIGARVKIVLATHTEQGNLYLLSVIGSGNRKSEVNSQLTAPLYIYQKARQEAMIPIIREAENRKRILEKRLEKLEREAAGEEVHIKRECSISDCSALRKKIEENPVPREPKYLVDNITLEELGSVMAHNEERVAILSAEGGIFKIVAGLYSKGHSNLDLILKAHTGEPWASDRVGRESQSMEHPALTLGLAVQPDVLEEIGRNSEFRGRGLSARFLYSWCQSRAGYRTLQTSPVPANVKHAYHSLIKSLMEIEGRHELTPTPEAQAIWSGFYADIEILLRPEGELEHLIDWGSKLPGAVARISELLHFAEHGPKGIGKPISADSVKYACVLGAYYCEHAKAAFDIMKEDVRLIAARKILDYIKRQKPEKFKGRDIMRHTALKTMEEVKPALIIMVERGYIAPVNKSQAGVGRPEADSYSVNPKIYQK